MDLENAIKIFLSQQRPTTAESYRYVLRDMARFIGEGRPLSTITPLLLAEYSDNVNARDYAPATRVKYAKTVKTFFNWLVKMDFATASPARIIKVRKLPMRVSRDKAMTDSEYESLLRELRYKPRDRALILFLGDTGCRAGGASGLRVEDLDLPNRRAYVTEKGDKTRQVAYGDQCASALSEWLLRRPSGAGVYVFSRTALPLQAATISQIVTRACIAAGVRPLGSHSLRHRKGHQFADARVAPSIAATALGHSDPTITLQHYYPADWATAEQWLKRLSTPTVDTDEKTPKIILLRQVK